MFVHDGQAIVPARSLRILLSLKTGNSASLTVRNHVLHMVQVPEPLDSPASKDLAFV